MSTLSRVARAAGINDFAGALPADAPFGEESWIASAPLARETWRRASGAAAVAG